MMSFVLKLVVLGVKTIQKKLDSSVCLKCLEEHKNAEPFCMSKIRGLDPYAKKV